jgi:EAL domain-containing protein (putative c-di-GMP-specific phosphodiesterase class I)
MVSSSDEFMPVVEETGLIIPLRKWVLEEAYRQVVARYLHLVVPLWVPLASASAATFRLCIVRDSLALNSILIRIQHQVVFIPAFRAAHLLAAMFAVGTVLATSAPAVAKHGEREVSEGGHDNGRHLGWYKHGRPAFADPAYPR